MSSHKPNILFLFADDQRIHTIHALGQEHIATPNLDRLVQNGTSFTRAYIPGGTSGAVCMPSRAMLHSGRGLFHIEGQGHTIPHAHTTLGEVLHQDRGYQTFGTGKWHNGKDSYQRSFSDGDEILFDGMADHWNVPAYHYDPTGKYDTTCAIVDDPAFSNEVRHRQCDHIEAGKHSSELVCEATIDFLQRRNSESPFFAYVSFLAPHDPRTMPQQYLDMYDPDEIELPPNFCGGHSFDTGALHIRDEMLAGFPRTPEATRGHIAEYYAMITHLDAQVGRMLKTLEEQQELDNTIVVFAGDNGLAVGQHGLFGKQNCYEHSVGVPLLFSGPGIPQDYQVEDLVYHFDIFPTLCSLTGAKIPQTVEGKDLTPIFQGKPHTPRECLYFAYTDVQRALRDDRFKLIEYAVPERERVTQLFDLKNDPWEMNNLVHDSAYQEKLYELQDKLRTCANEWDDQSTEWGKNFWGRYDAT